MMENFKLSENLIERVRTAIAAVPPEQFIARRRIDKTRWEVIHDLNPNGPIADETLVVIFEGSEEECKREAKYRQERVVAEAAARVAAGPLVLALRSAIKVAEEARTE